MEEKDIYKPKGDIDNSISSENCNNALLAFNYHKPKLFVFTSHFHSHPSPK